MRWTQPCTSTPPGVSQLLIKWGIWGISVIARRHLALSGDYGLCRGKCPHSSWGQWTATQVHPIRQGPIQMGTHDGSHHR